MADQFHEWGRLLALAQEHKTKAALRAAITEAKLNIHVDDPFSGYYRCAAVKDGPLLPVAIWRQDGNLIVLRGGEQVELGRVWPYCSWNPVPYDWYEAAVERGEPWPDAMAEAAKSVTPADTVKTVLDMVKADPNVDPAFKAGLGHNEPPVEDEAQTIKSQIEAAKNAAEKLYATISTDDEASAAQATRSRLLALSGEADKKRETEKRPHFEKAKEVDTRWQPVVKLGKDAADWLRARLSDFATRKANEEAAARRKAEEERAAFEAAARAEAEANGQTLPAEPAQVEPAPPPAAPTATTIKGASGRAATIRTVKVARVVDYDKAYAHLKAIPEIKKVIETVAQRMVTAGNEVPGVEVDEQRRVA